MPIHLWPGASTPSRREFLGIMAASTAGLAFADTRRDDHRDAGDWIAVLSDTHIHADPKHKAHGQRPAENLRVVVADILAAKSRPAAVVINGDLALKDGQPGDYATLLALLGPIRKAGIPIHATLGNHDHRGRFRQAAEGAGLDGSMLVEKQVAAFDAAGRRFLLLDSLHKVDGVAGELGAAQLDWLGRELDAAPERRTLVFVHHNPKTRHGSGLGDEEALFAVLGSRPWVEALVFGHTHHWSESIEPGIGLRLVNLPAVAYALGHDQPLGYCRLRFPAGQAEFALRDVARKAGSKPSGWHHHRAWRGHTPAGRLS